MLLESGCSEVESLDVEVSFPQENFHFPRSDRCLAERLAIVILSNFIQICTSLIVNLVEIETMFQSISNIHCFLVS